MSGKIPKTIFEVARKAPLVPVSKSRVFVNALNITITADPGVITFKPSGYLSHWPPAERDTSLDQTFYCDYTDVHDNKDAGIGVITFSAHGTWLNVTVFADPGVITLTPLGDYVEGVLVNADPGVITFTARSSDILTELYKTNWVQWSDIGSLDFTIWKDNIAGKRPLDWKGWIYNLKKLGNKIVAYGQNGVSFLIPSGNKYGLETIYRIGIKGKNAIAGTDYTHWFIDSKGQLWSLGEQLKKLDYSEFLSDLDNPVLSWDEENSLLYICDDALGFIYSPLSESLGEGPINITGIGNQTGVQYVASPDTIYTPKFEICTDIYDFGTRKGKGIKSLELGIDESKNLKASIDYRMDKESDFSQTSWYVVDGRGLAFIPCYGREFRFRAASDVYTYFEVDYFTINGVVHDH